MAVFTHEVVLILAKLPVFTLAAALSAPVGVQANGDGASAPTAVVDADQLLALGVDVDGWADDVATVEAKESVLMKALADAENAAEVRTHFEAYAEALEAGPPYVYLSPAFVAVAVAAALRTKAWDVIRALVMRGVLSATATPALIPTLIDNAQWGLLASVLVHVSDLTEEQLFALLELLVEAHVGQSEQGQAFRASIEALFDAIEAGTLLVEDIGLIPEVDAAHAAAVSRAWPAGGANIRHLRMGSDSAVDTMISLVFGYSHSGAFLRPHLRRLEVPALTVLLKSGLKWMSRYMRRSFDDLRALRSPLLPIPRFSAILDWMRMLLDTHFADMVLDDECWSSVGELTKLVSSQLVLCDELQSIDGILAQLSSKSSRLVVANVPDYSVELLNI